MVQLESCWKMTEPTAAVFVTVIALVAAPVVNAVMAPPDAAPVGQIASANSLAL